MSTMMMRANLQKAKENTYNHMKRNQRNKKLWMFYENELRYLIAISLSIKRDPIFFVSSYKRRFKEKNNGVS